jgi:hypothetical protein
MTSINLDSFYDPTRAAAASFDKIGDCLAGTILDIELVSDQFNPGALVLRVKVADDSGVAKDVYLRSAGMKEAVGKAVVQTGGNSIDVGGRLTLTYSGDKPLRSGKSMKTYVATYAPPSPMGTGTFGEESLA